MRLVPLALALSTLALAAPAGAQVYGQFTGAATVPVGSRLFGGYVLSSENTLGMLAQLRLSFYPNVDFGFHGGIARQDFPAGDRTTIRLGTGMKVKLSDSTAALPLTLAIAGDLGIETGDDYNQLVVAPSIIVSRTFGTGSGALTPYARIGLAIARVDLGDVDDSDLSIPLRFGADFQVAQQLRLVAELQLNLSDSHGDDVGLGAGINIPF